MAIKLKKNKSCRKGRFSKLLILNFWLFNLAIIFGFVAISILSTLVIKHFTAQNQVPFLRMSQPINAASYRLAMSFEHRIQWMIFPIYLCFAAFYAWWLIRKIKHCIQPINDAFVNFSHGLPSNLSAYCGPDEFVDIAENFCKLEQQLAQSELEREKLDHQRQQLLADISHDLKTPITVIQGYAGALRDGVVPADERQQYLDTIFHNTEKVADLLSTFHEYSTLAHPEMPVTLVRKDLCAAVQSYFSARYQELTLSGFSVEAEIPDDAVFCMLDERLLCRAMENIVNNAVKYNPIGTCIFVAIEPCLETVTLSICDNGVGIPPSLKDTLFNPFTTGDITRGNGHGSGLGLAITKKIIDLHHGTIALMQNQKYVTGFSITLPLCPET